MIYVIFLLRMLLSAPLVFLFNCFCKREPFPFTFPPSFSIVNTPARGKTFVDKFSGPDEKNQFA